MSFISKSLILFHTIRFLKPIQVYARGMLIIKKLLPQRINWFEDIEFSIKELIFHPSISFPDSNSDNSFEFLNLRKEFQDKINWDYLDFGKLWTYNLNYFEYLNQTNMTPERGVILIESFIEQVPTCKVGLEPYPVSLRSFNWIKFFLKYEIRNSRFDSILFKQLELLTRKLEYHLLGNHLLENGIALLFGAYYFNNKEFYKKAKKILISQMEEQILNDGAHFELSPMYHSIILFRLLDCYNLVSNNTYFNGELVPVLKEKNEAMLSWLQKMTFRNGDIPLMNDAAFKIAPSTRQLIDYARSLRLDVNKQIKLKNSGYRKLSSPKFELIADIGSIGPDYQPGHAHADTLNFELHINSRPVIVDSGTSTYEINDTRFYERSTAAHNSVVIQGVNSSQVWSGHRVAKRAKVTILKDQPDIVSASHNGYKNLKQKHSRTFQVVDETIQIIDEITEQGIAYLHFRPNEEFRVNDKSIISKDYVISFSGAESIECFDSEYSPEFNKRIPSKSIKINFEKRLVISIQ